MGTVGRSRHCHHRFPFRRNLNMISPSRGQIKMPRTKQKLCLGTNRRIRGATQFDACHAGHPLTHTQICPRGNGRDPVRYYAFGKRSSCPPKSIHTETVPPFHPRRLSWIGFVRATLLHHRFNAGIIAHPRRFVKGFGAISLTASKKSTPRKRDASGYQGW